jgi:hypothetical protein
MSYFNRVALLLVLTVAAEGHAGARVVRRQVKPRGVASARVPVAASPSPDAVPQAAATEAPWLGASGLSTPLQLRLQAGVVWRSLDFEQDIYGRMRSQNAGAYVYRVDATAFPFFLLDPVGAYLGLVAGYEGAFAGAVQDANFDFQYPVNLSEWFAGLRARGVLREHTLGFELTLGQLTAGLDDRDDRAGTPDFRYTQVRTGLDVTFELERVRASAAAGFRLPLSYGEIGEADWFPRIGGYGLDLTLNGSYRIAHGISAEVSACLRRFLLEMNPAPEDPRAGLAEVAGGAIDVYLGAYAGFSFQL